MRHINHMTMDAWHAEYLSWCESRGVPADDRSSSRTFRNAYDKFWKPILKMREISQHARWGYELSQYHSMWSQNDNMHYLVKSFSMACLNEKVSTLVVS